MGTDNFQHSLNAKDLHARLGGASPLEASRILIDVEIFDKQSSLEILDNIYKEFDTKDDVIKELVQPLGLNVLDGIISHKDLGLNRTGITASRLWAEINSFDYSSVNGFSASSVTESQQLNALREKRRYGKNIRKQMTNRKNLENSKNKTFGSGTHAYSDLEINDDGSRVVIIRHKKIAEARKMKHRASDTDHLVPVKQINDQYAKNCFLTDADLAHITDGSHNLVNISNSLNRSKGAGTFRQMSNEKKTLEAKVKSGVSLSPDEQKRLKSLSRHTDKTLEKSIEAEDKAKEDVRKSAADKAKGNIVDKKSEIASKAGRQALDQTAYQAIGHAVIEIIKPLFYELSDSFKNGIEYGVNMNTVIDGIKFRFSRVMNYIKCTIIPTLSASIRDMCMNFFKILIEGILGLVTGLFKSVIKVISEGFSAFVSAAKILLKPDSEISASEKADAIVKIFASTVTTFVVFYFEQTILKVVPIQFLRDISTIILSGVASTIVVYLLDKADIFSKNSEKRSKRVAEIFNHRILTIKENTDAYNSAGIKVLAEQRLAFMHISESIGDKIVESASVVEDTLDLAGFLKVEIKVRDTMDFFKLLEESDALVI